jgi:chemotaxis response regulator CheB
MITRLLVGMLTPAIRATYILLLHREPRPVIMLSSLMREGDPMRVEAELKGAAGCFNKSRMVSQSRELIDMIKEVAYSRGHRGDIPRLPLSAMGR